MHSLIKNIRIGYYFYPFYIKSCLTLREKMVLLLSVFFKAVTYIVLTKGILKTQGKITMKLSLYS